MKVDGLSSHRLLDCPFIFEPFTSIHLNHLLSPPGPSTFSQMTIYFEPIRPSTLDLIYLRHLIIYQIISVPLLNMTSAAPLSVVLSLLSQRKEGKRGRRMSHV